MRTPALLVFSMVASPAIAQESHARVQPLGIAQVISRATGLQAHPHADGLLGFGAGYFAHFRQHEVRCDVLQQRGAAPAFVALSSPTLTRGGVTVATRADAAPVANDRRASYQRGTGIAERFDVGPDGVELSWTFAERPPGEGDLVVRYDVATSFGEPSAADGGLSFTNATCGVTIGRVTGVDCTGASVAGTAHWDGTGVAFSLPAAFVDHAAYPITLDPTVGPTFMVAPMNHYALGDAAYDATTDHWLIVWKLVGTGSGNDWLLTQLVSNASGALIGNTGVLAMLTVAGVPRVANLGRRDEFAVAYRVNSGNLSFLVVSRVSATTGADLGATTVATTMGSFLDVNIGARVEPPPGSDSGFTVIYQAVAGLVGPGQPLPAIEARRLTYLASGGLAVGPAVPIWTDTQSARFSSLRMSRAAAADGKLLAVAARLAGGIYSIVATQLDAGSDTPGIAADLVANTGQAATSLQTVDVDGYAGRWTVAYDAPGSNLVSGPSVRVSPVTINTAGNGFVVGSGTTFGGTQTNQASLPSVAYAPGRTWLAYYSLTSSLSGTSALRRVVAIDSATCASCGDGFSAFFPNPFPATELVLNRCLATTTIGGASNGEHALFVWGESSNPPATLLLAQQLRDYGTAGTTQNLGGSCGSPGSLAFNHAPGIGSSGFRCTLNGMAATALVTIFNLGPPNTTIPCGACVWTPFAATATPPIVGGAAFVEVAIPCLTTLIGQQVVAQWTVIDLTKAPCAAFPGFTLSDRTLVTIGN